jgi:DNA-directed RNA polymerase specialized sigma24 family protein
MGVRDEERLGSRQSAVLKALARAEKRSRAAELALDGLTPQEIGRRLRVDGGTIGVWLREAGVVYKRTPGGRELPHGLP